jgi:transposase
VRRVAAMFAVSPSFVVKLAQAWRQRGTVAARPQGGDRRSTALERHRDWQLVAETPDLTLAEIHDRLGEHGTPASISAIWRLFDRHSISFKKTAHAAERSISSLWTRIGKLLDQSSADECRHYLAHAGYV